ncbi:MAG: FAD-dependent monooxygenase [Phycisphaerales bacterium]|nr:FAD-dependent monooxygenase [Phycisphaerales bacterium]
MTDRNDRPLIAGAGPAGLAAALFLARHGIRARIIDKERVRSPYSRALAVNPRTLDLLEPTGVTERMLALGRRIASGRVVAGDRLIFEPHFEQVSPRFPFLVALSQATTEQLLAEALAEFDIDVERGVALTSCALDEHGARVTLQADDDEESWTVPWLLAADGAHSTVRHELALEFRGRTFEKEWNLLDVPLETSRTVDQAHIEFLTGGGFLFMLPVVTDDAVASDTHAPIWRMITNRATPLECLRADERAGMPIWKSSFHIAHRVIERMQTGAVSFIGDAAHIHSPLGARGMNLGIEDAWIFAQCVSHGVLSTFADRREPDIRRVVGKIEFLTRMARGETTVQRAARRLGPAVARFVPAVRRTALRTLTGLDITRLTPEDF